ncbi:EF-hand domain-containing protein [Nitrospirillum iridis]|uniref:EF-hand domain-containing protein n=1 Tax=Nitrospirillum iridis TaxID=765888 RepID=A0A7X0EEQ1_9PROT|nr:EF-hand domain-containing protein [Nitrospirillum iridis]MBB6253260.1 hypothetical protein [Nitrospirillum iridis]
MKKQVMAAACGLLLLGSWIQDAGADDGQDGAASTSPAGAPPGGLAGDASKNPDMTAFAKEVDTNGDGKMSREEWLAKGLPISSFNMFEKGRGYVTLDDYQKNPAPPGIDLNGDGTLTVEEFKQFDKMMSARQGANPPPAPPRSNP